MQERTLDVKMKEGLGCWQAFLFFLKHSFRDIGRRKCHFCLALCSVFIVVLATLIVNTVTSKGPVIFMKLAQESSGEIDGVFTAQAYDNWNINYHWNDWWSLNYTRTVEVLEENNIEHHLSPRYANCPPSNQTELINSQTGK